MKKILTTVFLFYIYSLNASENLKNFIDNFQETFSRDEIEDKIKKYLEHDKELENLYLITQNSFLMFASYEDKLRNNPEYILNFGSKPKPIRPKFIPNNFTDKPLIGLKIAIDPGHIGGKMAIIEERFIDISITDKTRIQFDEGTLATITAKILKTYLVKLGAEVLLTREEPGKSVYQLSFEDWYKKEYGTNKLEYIDDKLFRSKYNLLDLCARAEKINAFDPHLTIIIHFNGNGGAHDVSTQNYNLAFIPGSFLKGELSNKLSREEFVWLLVSDNLDSSLILSKAIVENMEKELNVTLMKDKKYLSSVSLFVDSGIYSRNLTLTRKIYSPLCYGETLIQNNLAEALRLSQKDFDFEGEKISSRLVEVANAYLYGICEYLGLDLMKKGSVNG